MKSGKYIKDRLYSMCIFVAMLIISVLMMAAFKVSVQLIIAEICIMIICYIAVVLADYYHRKKFYDELEANIAALEEKYLITACAWTGGLRWKKLILRLRLLNIN